MKKTIFSLIMLAVGCLSASAQEATTKEVFNPHWYVQAQAGFQHTLGEIAWSKLNSFNAQVGVGYQFSSVWGARLTASGWRSKGGITLSDVDYKYKWNYVAPTLNVTFDVTNAIWGFNPKRVVDFGIFAGGGVNIAWKNDEAGELKTSTSMINTSSPYMASLSPVDFMEYYWEGTKVRPVGQFGCNLDFKLCKRVSLGIEASWNIISDKYNSKKAGNVDWYFNTLAGVKIALGKTTKTVAVEPCCRTVEVEKIVTKHDTVYVNKKEISKDPLRRDIFFTIRGSEVSKAEMPKIEDVAAYLNKYPEAKVSITGYADKGTGTPAGNVKYAKNRADMVAKILTDKFGISASRITVDSKGDTVQPYDINDLNRVSICIAQ